MKMQGIGKKSFNDIRGLINIEFYQILRDTKCYLPVQTCCCIFGQRRNHLFRGAAIIVSIHFDMNIGMGDRDIHCLVFMIFAKINGNSFVSQGKIELQGFLGAMKHFPYKPELAIFTQWKLIFLKGILQNGVFNDRLALQANSIMRTAIHPDRGLLLNVL
jgi:hypothetical protein